MIYAIGIPNQIVRIFITTNLRSTADLQAKTDEVVVPVESSVKGRIKAKTGGGYHVVALPDLHEQLNYIPIRDGKLRGSDWTQLPDSPLTETQKQAWVEYRAALRDLPDTQPGADLNTVVWPVEPS